MRPLFQNGVGPQRFSKTLRILHKENFNEKQLQYYSALKDARDRTPDGINGEKQREEFSTFDDSNKYNGHIPAAKYMSYVYSSYIQELKPFMDQHTAKLDGAILKGDHSFKIIKHMGKVNGDSTFSALYIVLNEYGEIRIQVLAHTKALSHLAQSFTNMMKSYEKYGFEKLNLFSTDNVSGDRDFLEKVMPSLTDNVEHLKTSIKEYLDKNDQYSHLPITKIPDDFKIDPPDIADTIEGINLFCQEILAKESTSEKLVIGFDCKWVSPNRITLVQICFQKRVFLLCIYKIDRTMFPARLADVIHSPNILKVGKSVGQDLNKHCGQKVDGW